MLKDNILETENLNVFYGETAAVSSLSLSARRNESVGIIGESGSGKSTLLKAIAGILPGGALTSGTITFDGRDLNSLPRKTRRQLLGSEISMIFQNPESFLDPVVRVGRQMEEYLMARNALSRKDALERSLNLLSSLSLPDPERVMDSYPFELSGGMCQRVSIAMAAANHHLKLLLADEPTSALDQNIRSTTAELLMKVRAEREAVLLLVTHDMRLIEQTANHIYVMYKGLLVEGGRTKEVLEHPGHPYTESLIEAIPEKGKDFRHFTMYKEPAEALMKQKRVAISGSHWALK